MLTYKREPAKRRDQPTLTKQLQQRELTICTDGSTDESQENGEAGVYIEDARHESIYEASMASKVSICHTLGNVLPYYTLWNGFNN